MTKPPHYYAKFQQKDGYVFRHDTRIYLHENPATDCDGNCLGAIVGINPGSAKPIKFDVWCPLDLGNDKLLPFVRNRFCEALKITQIPIKPNYFIRVWNLSYLCKPNLDQALQNKLFFKEGLECPTESELPELIWFAWGFRDSHEIRELKKRFLQNIPAETFYINQKKEIVQEAPKIDSLVRHTRGMGAKPVVDCLSEILIRRVNPGRAMVNNQYLPPRMNHINFSLNRVKFLQQFERFKTHIKTKSGNSFASFGTGLPYDEEHYKEVVYHEGRRRLSWATWTREEVGTGRILQRVIDAVEIKGNNLVDWDLRHGASARTHKAMIEAAETRTQLSAWESLFFDLYRESLLPEEAFDRLMHLAGRRYDLLAYIFYLKDWTIFLPIGTETFDKAFELLGIDLTTSRNASWNNYQAFLEAMRQIRDALRNEGLEEARLIDAHSFCWIIGRSEIAQPELVHIVIVPEPLVIGAPPSSISNEDEAKGRVQVIDWNRLRENQALLGRVAEGIALDAERERLCQAGRGDLAKMAAYVAEDHTLGYDIKSFEVDGTDRFIEVKAANLENGIISFYLTDNELRKSQKLPRYFFYLVFNARTSGKRVRFFSAQDLMIQWLHPVLHMARVGDSNVY